MDTLPFDPTDLNNNGDALAFHDSSNKIRPTQPPRPVNILNQKTTTSIWSSQQLEPFVKKITNRISYDAVSSVLQELDAVSQRQSIILAHFVFYLQPLMHDSNDVIRDLSILLIMRYLRLNPK
jgi:hypothetical protein